MCNDLLRVKYLRTASCHNGSESFATRKLTRPIWPSLEAPTETTMVAAETREGATTAMMATEEAAKNFMVTVLNVNEPGMDDTVEEASEAR